MPRPIVLNERQCEFILKLHEIKALEEHCVNKATALFNRTRKQPTQKEFDATVLKIGILCDVPHHRNQVRDLWSQMTAGEHEELQRVILKGVAWTTLQEVQNRKGIVK